jgi:hypothetical protein
LVEVDELARQLRDYLTANAALISRSHVHGARSSVIQKLLSDILSELGFDEEVILTPQDGLVTRARPDFVFGLGPGRGVLAEVERGGTVTNNHDLKDLWKAHIALDAQHLFLVVPVANVRADGSPRERPFVRVVNRIGAFFGDARREVDVVSAHIFGY